MDTAKKVLIIDDHRLFADGLQVLLNQLDHSLSISTEYESSDALENIEKIATYDLLLVDLQMPDLDGFGLLEAIKVRNMATRILIISGSEKLADIERALALGAKGFIPKNSPGNLILQGIRSVLDGNIFLPPDLTDEIDWSIADPVQSAKTKEPLLRASGGNAAIRARQLEVLRLMRDGHSNSQIAAILNISISAVKAHIAILFNVLQVKNRTACVQAGIENRLI